MQALRTQFSAIAAALALAMTASGGGIVQVFDPSKLTGGDGADVGLFTYLDDVYFNNAGPGCTIDVNQPSNTVCMAIFNQTDLAQSFQPTVNQITGAGIFLRSTPVGTGNITIELWDGLPNAGGNFLTSGTAPGGSGDWVDVNWPPVAVAPGDEYFLVLLSDNGGLCVAGDTNNPYPGGQVYANPGFGSFPAFDYTFRTCGSNVGQVNFFEDPKEFDNAVNQSDKFLKGEETFEEAIIDDGDVIGMDDPLDTTTDNGVFSPGDILFNLVFQSNLDGPGINGPNPRGIDGLVALGAGFGGIPDKAVSSNFLADSFDIMSLSPDHTAMALRVTSLFDPSLVEVRVFDKNDRLVGETTINVTLDGTFIGIFMKDRDTFSRINLWSSAGQAEGVLNVEAYVNAPHCPWDCGNNDGNVGIVDFLALLAQWGVPGSCDFDGGGVGIVDFLKLLANWGPCTVCGPGAGPCDQPNGTPGCDNADCCEAVCAIDPFCCEVAWDSLCVDETSKFPECNEFGCSNDPANGDCCVSNGSPGCDNAECCRRVCAIDPFCCNITWDSQCADEAAGFPQCLCPHPPNDLCEDAIGILVPSTVTGDTTNATFDDVGFCGTSNTAPGIWYSVIGTGTTITASTCNAANFDTKISVFCPCDDLTCIAGVDDTAGCGGFTTEVSWCSEIGAEYLILVHGFGDATGIFTLTMSEDGIGCTPDVFCPTPANCDEPGVCGNFVNCQDDPDCLCFTLSDGSPFCGTGVACGDLKECVDGDCPPGFVCQVETCCGVDVCVPVETKCTGAAAPDYPPGTLTTTGVVPK